MRRNARGVLRRMVQARTLLFVATFLVHITLCTDIICE